MQLTTIEKIKNYLVVILLVLLILYFGRTLLIPLSFSILISFLMYPISKKLEGMKVSRSLSVVVCISILIMIGVGVSFLLYQQLASFSHEWGKIRSRIPDAILQIKSMFNSMGVSVSFQEKMLTEFQINSTPALVSIIKSLLYSSGEMIVWLILIPIFSSLLLLNRTPLLKALYSLFHSAYNEKIRELMQQIVKAYYDFIKGMLIVYLIVGILNGIGLWIVGIPNPFLFGFIASILTFIPFVGIIIGSLLPMSLAWISYNSVWYPAGVVLVFTIVQYLEANIIFPLAVSSRLKISALATIISIFAGGIIWGAAGMILFVPFLAILKLIADNFSELKPLSLLLEKSKS